VALTHKTGHLAWCALVALALARKEQGELSPAQENLSHPLAGDSAGNGFRAMLHPISNGY
jgi:hypothetical protein